MGEIIDFPESENHCVIEVTSDRQTVSMMIAGVGENSFLNIMTPEKAIELATLLTDCAMDCEDNDD